MTARTSPSWARVDGPLAPYAGGFRVELERLGYTPLTAATHVRLMAHLSRWLAHEGAEVSGLTPALVARLLGLLAGRMMTQVALAGGGGGGERDERAGQAVGAAGGQGPAMAS